MSGRPTFAPDQAEEFTQSLGQIIGGSWRQIAWADRNGIPAALGMTTRDWVEQRLGGYVRLQMPERREAIAELNQEGMTQREIANVIGVGQGTVARDLKPDPNGSADEPDQDTSTESDPDGSPPPPLKPKPSPAEERRKAKEEAARQVADSFGRAVHALAALADANGAITELVTSYGPPALDLDIRDLRQASKALSAITQEWRKVK